MSDLKLQVKRREETGKNACRRLRQAGEVPAVVYGADREAVPITVEKRKVLELLKSAGSERAVFLLEMAGGSQQRHTMIRSIDSDPVTRQILHIDFQRILLTEKVKVEVPIELVGTAEGVKNESGVLDFVTREVHVECLPTDIPASFVLDVTPLHVGQHLEVGDLEVPETVEMLDEESRVLVSIARGRVEEEVEEVEEAELLEADVEEPELIGKTKEEEDSE